MAEEMVLWSNLERKLGGPEVALLLHPLRDELARLRDLVRRSQGVVVALEDRDYTPGDLMHGWLVKHSALLSQADDLLDQILTVYRCTRLRRCGFNQAKKMARRVEKISKDIRRLIEMNDLDNQPEQRRFQHIEWSRPAEERVIGRDNVKAEIVNMLLRPPTDSGSNVSVIYMSGLPGVGKSTLAKEIYEDHKVKNHFDLKMWIPVSGITKDTAIISKIVKTCTNRRLSHGVRPQSPWYHKSCLNLMGCQNSRIETRTPNNTATSEEIELHKRHLRKQIRGKLHLIVLDDFCLETWQSLRDLLTEGAKGSWVFVTTRLPVAADLLNSATLEIIPYSLPGLSREHSWTLFKTMNEICDDEMQEIGLEIADICKYVPLTIKVAARFLHGKNWSEWLTFSEGLRLRSTANEDIMDRVLYLSYSDLPTNLRACFGYCSLFPVDFTFNKNDLISLWIAQGFVDPEDGRSLQEAGERYFMELLRRCFFEEVRIDELGNIMNCKMHHIMWSLASSSFTTRISDPVSKHVLVNCRGDFSLKFSLRLLKCLSLRTLIFEREIDCNIKVDRLVLYHMISRYKRLRVLDLHDLGLKELPYSIGDQIHLRYLDLSKNDVVTLPWSLTKLYNLQTLKLNSCPKLERLVNDLGSLVNLKCLEVDECDSLTSMPLGFEKLTKLEKLSRFVVGSSSSKWILVDILERVLSVVMPSVAPLLAAVVTDATKSGSLPLELAVGIFCSELPASVHFGLKVLSGLTMLRGTLAIDLTGEWMTSIPGTEQALCNKENLVEVKIRWPKSISPISDVEVSSEARVLAHEEILMHLKPHPNLKILRIDGYEGNEFPSWTSLDMISSTIPNLVIISIEGCENCTFLPPFGELSHLRELTLRHMPNVVFVENVTEEAIQDRPFFRALQELTLHNFYKLEGWWKDDSSIQQAQPRSFPPLLKLRIWDCPNLRSLPSFTGVSDLDLHNVDQWLLVDSARKTAILENRNCTTSLQIKSCHNMTRFETVREGLGGLPSLKHLVLEDCKALVSLADDVGKIPSLERLEISRCEELDLSHELQLAYRVSYRVLREEMSLSPWKSLKFLRELTLSEIPKMKSLPIGLKHVHTLEVLRISTCLSLGSLPEWISNLTALQHLGIESCHALKRLPQGLKDVKTLMKLEITDCPELIKRCREQEGEDWQKIKHARILLNKSRRYRYVSHL